MSDAISVQCPKCSARLKLKSRSAVGKRVPCPKCKTPFVVEAPPEEDDLEFMGLSEPGDDEFAAPPGGDGSDEFADAAPSTAGRSSLKKRPKKKPTASGNWKKPALFAGLGVGVLALLGGVGFFIIPLIAELFSGNKIDMAWLPPDSDVVVQARLADTWNAPFVKSLLSGPANQGLVNVKEMIGLEPQEISNVTFGAAGVMDLAKAPAAMRTPGMPGGPGMNGPKPPAIVVLRMAQSFEPKLMQNKLRGVRTAVYKGQELAFLGGTALAGMACFFPDSKTVVLGSEADVKSAIDRGSKAQRRPDLDFIDASRHLVIVMAPKDPSAFDSTGPPSPMAGQVLAILEPAKGKVKGLCLGVAFAENLDWSAAANCTTPEAAKEISAAFDKSLQEAKVQFNQLRSNAPPQLAELVASGDAIQNSITFNAQGDVVEAKGQVPASIKAAAQNLPQLMLAFTTGALPGTGGLPGQAGGPGAQSLGGPPSTTPDLPLPGSVSSNPLAVTGEAAELALCKNNLKRLGLAMHNYHATFKAFPAAAIRDKSGKPLLSWRVALLPYLEQAELYAQFHHDEPWDSDHNKPLIARMPEIFACPSGHAPPGATSYLAVVGAGSIFENGDAHGMSDIKDGTSNTILLVEAGDSRAVVWTKPDDYTYDPQDPMQGLVGRHPGGFPVLAADGAAYFLKETLDPKLLVALFTRSGGEQIPPGTLQP